MSELLLVVFMAAWAFTEWRNWSLRSKLAELRLEHDLNTTILRMTTKSLHTQNEVVKELKAIIDEDKEIMPPRSAPREDPPHLRDPGGFAHEEGRYD
jgi:hypothetical protein